MNRRRLLSMLPLAPAALVVGVVAPVEATPEPIDTRTTYRRSNYVLIRPVGEIGACRACDQSHEFFTHGCRPIAFPATQQRRHFGEPAPVTDDAVPNEYAAGGCSIGRNGPLPSPHQHHDFRWVA